MQMVLALAPPSVTDRPAVHHCGTTARESRRGEVRVVDPEALECFWLRREAGEDAEVWIRRYYVEPEINPFESLWIFQTHSDGTADLYYVEAYDKGSHSWNEWFSGTCADLSPSSPVHDAVPSPTECVVGRAGA